MRQTVASISGGQSSAFIAANFKHDRLVFALVRIEDKNCAPKDKGLIKQVQDRIDKPFIATAEDDLTLTAVLELEQFIGQKIDWVTGITYDEVVRTKGGWLPNSLHRYCTTNMKIEPIFRWWLENFDDPVNMSIGFRADQKELRRKNNMLEKTNKDGFSLYEHYEHVEGKKRRKKFITPWRKPIFPMIDMQPTYKQDVKNYWKGKPVTFAPLNNCVGCFNRNPLLLRTMFDYQPEKMEWFARQERNPKKGTWRSDCRYDTVKENAKQGTLFDFGDFGECDSGHCGI